jgi:hypothetical protein
MRVPLSKYSTSILLLVLICLATIGLLNRLENARPATPLTCTNVTLPSTQPFNLPLCTSHSLTQRNEAIKRAIIIVLPGQNSGGSILAAVKQANLAAETMVIAPTFAEGTSADPRTILFWDGAWRFGYPSINGPNVSSFRIIDDIIALLADSQHFPNLKQIVVTGFSAGGQFANRYAAINTMQQQIEQQSNHRLQFRYVVGSPSIYLYMDAKRWNAASQSFRKMNGSRCPANDYPYGLGNLRASTAYVRNLSAAQIYGQYGQRDVYYLIGQNDTNRDSGLTTGCESDAQGANRVERGQRYYQHIQQFFGGNTPTHRIVIVPGIGHSDEVYNSDLGRPTLFDN